MGIAGSHNSAWKAMKKYLIVARELMVVERTPRTPGFAVRARSRSRCLLNALNLRLDLLHSLAAHPRAVRLALSP